MIWTPFYNPPIHTGRYVCRTKYQPEVEFFAWYSVKLKFWYLDSDFTQELHPSQVDEWKYSLAQTT